MGFSLHAASAAPMTRKTNTRGMHNLSQQRHGERGAKEVLTDVLEGRC